MELTTGLNRWYAPPQSITKVSITLRKANSYDGSLEHIVDAYVDFVLVRNQKDKDLIISRHTRLGTIGEEGCYHGSMEDLDIAESRTPESELCLSKGTTIYGAKSQVCDQ